jgi:hypothetical protein
MVWRPADVTGWVWTTITALAGIVVSYLGVSSTDHQSAQQAWIAVGVGALTVVGVGNAMWVAAGARAVAIRRAAVLRRLDPICQRGPVDRPPSAAGALVAGPAMTRYHRADCLFARGKAVKPASAKAHRAAGRAPCPVCQPEEST